MTHFPLHRFDFSNSARVGLGLAAREAASPENDIGFDADDNLFEPDGSFGSFLPFSLTNLIADVGIDLEV